MATVYNPDAAPIKNQSWSFSISLVDQGDTDVFQETVTLAVGDIQVSLDGGTFANLATFPPAERKLAGGVTDSGVLLVLLTAAEMNASRVDVLFRDAAGAEWQSVLVNIFPVVAVTPDVQVTGLANDVITAAAFDESTAYPLKSADTGSTAVARTGADSDTLETLSDQMDAMATVAQVADGVWDETAADHVAAGTTGKAIADILDDTGTSGVALANDAITSGKFDESTAYPLKSADTGSTAVARVGADGDTLETLSDQLDGVEADTTHITADYGATEKAAIDLLDDVDGGLADIHTVVNAISSALSTVSTNVTTVLARIGAFTGSGVNTILGFLKAIMSKAASTPSDVGGTFAASTDSLEAIRDALSSSTVTVVAAVDGDQISVVPYTTWEFTISGLASLAGALTNGVLFTVKERYTDPDTSAILQVQEGVGLVRLNGAAGTAAKATLVVAGSEDAITVHVNASQTGAVAPAMLVWDIKMLILSAEDADQMARGEFIVGDEAVTRALTV